MNPKIAVILLNWNGKEDTLACLGSLKQVSYPHLDILVVDNGSKDGSTDAVAERFPEFFLIKNEKNLGFAEGNNVGMRAALSRGADFLLLLNNDTVVDPSLFEAFLKTFRQFPRREFWGQRFFYSMSQRPSTIWEGYGTPKKGCSIFVGLRQKHLEEEWKPPERLTMSAGQHS